MSERTMMLGRGMRSVLARTVRVRRALALAVLLLLALVATGCVHVPATGPIRSTGTVPGDVLAEGVPAIDPEPPAPGAGPGAIVRESTEAPRTIALPSTTSRPATIAASSLPLAAKAPPTLRAAGRFRR